MTNLRVEDVNTTAIRLTWQKQPDYLSSYSYLVQALDLRAGTVVYNVSTQAETYTFIDLIPGNEYKSQVYAVVSGVKSEVTETTSFISTYLNSLNGLPRISCHAYHVFFNQNTVCISRYSNHVYLGKKLTNWHDFFRENHVRYKISDNVHIYFKIFPYALLHVWYSGNFASYFLISKPKARKYLARTGKSRPAENRDFELLSLS